MNVAYTDVVSSWQRLRDRYDWQIIGDDAAFIQQVVELVAESQPQAAPSLRQTEGCIIRLYNKCLYHALLAGLRDGADEQALARANRVSQELAQFMLRHAVLRGYSEAVRNDVVQQVFLRLISMPASIKSPENLMTWIIWQIRAALKTLRCHSQVYQRSLVSLESCEAANGPIADPTSVIDRVDWRLRNNELEQLLRAVLSPFQRSVVVLTMIEGQPEREAALILGVDISRVYREKCRARQKLRNSKRLMLFLTDGYDIPDPHSAWIRREAGWTGRTTQLHNAAP
jgi:RNA polymerase sigma factor (sigma-70 family)